MLLIDGSQGEGGGQVVRTALALSVWTGTPFRIERIRAGRSRPGLLRQHLTAVRAAQEVSGAECEGAELNSTTLTFSPGRPRAGSYSFRIGSAGSTTLVLQTVLLPLLAADGVSEVTVEGGTHNPSAPPYPFLVHTFLPLLARMGAQVEVRLERPGFFPAGGGRLVARIHPVRQWRPLTLLERGEVRSVRAHALVSDIPEAIAVREASVLREALGLTRETCGVEVLQEGLGPGNVVRVEVESEALTETFTGFGEVGVRAEVVARRVATEVKRYLAAPVPVGEKLADQLLPYLAVGAGGTFRTLPLSGHASTNLEVVQRFLKVPVQVERESSAVTRVKFPLAPAGRGSG